MGGKETADHGDNGRCRVVNMWIRFFVVVVVVCLVHQPYLSQLVKINYLNLDPQQAKAWIINNIKYQTGIY